MPEQFFIMILLGIIAWNIKKGFSQIEKHLALIEKTLEGIKDK